MPQLDGINLVSTEQMKLTFIFLLGLSLQSVANAASFDCSKASTQVERLICGDSALSKMDEVMAEAYRAALRDKKSAGAVMRLQRQWVKERDSTCASAECVKLAYDKQLTLLKLPISTTEAGIPVIARSNHAATLLPTGKVLVVGGWQERRGYLDSAEIYDPASGRFSLTGKLVTHSRGSHFATLLPNGKVLVAGGEAPFEGNDPIGPLGSAELYDPLAGKFVETGGFLPFQYVQHGIGLAGSTTATLLASGKVLYARLFMTDGGTAELYDPVTGRFSGTGNFVEGRFSHTATLLPNGKVLFVGGKNNLMKNLSSAELYDPATGTFKLTASLSTARYGHTATLLQNGKVLVAGGQTGDTPIASAELYDPATGRFTVTGQLLTMRVGHTATLLKNGKVLIAGGNGADGELVSLELYDPTTGIFTSAGRLIYARTQLSATLLQDGRVLFLGGANAELYE